MKIFVSYSHQDASVAEKIASELKRCGHDVFLDIHQLDVGDIFNRKLKQAIDRSDIFVFLASPNSLRQNCWARRELDLAMNFRSSLTNIWIVPVILAGHDGINLPSNIQNLTNFKLASHTDASVAELCAKISRIQTRRSRYKLRLATAIPLALLLPCALLTAWYFSLPTLTLYTGQEGSTYNLIGQYLKNSLARSPIGERYRIAIRPTHGSVQNCTDLVGNPKGSHPNVEIALFQLAAHQNTPECSPGRVVYLAPLYDEVTHVIVRKTSFKGIDKNKNLEMTPCLFRELGLPMAIGLPGSSTRMVADKLLEHCQEGTAGIYPLKFKDAQESLTSNGTALLPHGVTDSGKETKIQIDLAFFNQAAQSPIILGAVTNNAACILSLSETDANAAQKDLKLEILTREQ